MSKSIYISEGWRFFKRRLRVAFKGLHAYPGNAENICNAIVKDCFNGKYFQVSKNNFSQFYARDTGWCAKALLVLGYKKELKQTLAHTLSRFEKHGAITVALTPKERPFNFPEAYSIDSVSYFYYTLSLLNDKDLVNKHRPFLQKQADHFFKTAIDSKTGLVKPTHFSAMRDHVIRKSSCYDNVMAWLMQRSLQKLNIKTNLNNYNYKKIIMTTFWNGSYFYDDLNKKDEVVADANIFPFWFGLINDKTMLKKVVKSIEQAKLDTPFPLKYTTQHPEKVIIYERFVRGWEDNYIWSMMGMIYIELLSTIDKKKAQKYLSMYEKLIEKYGTFIENYDSLGKPYTTTFYATDEGLLWAGMYLYLNSIS